MRKSYRLSRGKRIRFRLQRDSQIFIGKIQMGRPSLAKQRSEEILEAFSRCVAKFGIEGSSLERIAEESGMTRSIIRHYIGNRDELIDALALKCVADYRAYTRAGFESIKPKAREKQLVNLVLPETSVGTTDQLLVIESLIGVSSQYPKVRKLVLEYVEEYIDLIAEQLILISPRSTRMKCWDTAYGIVCISFNQESLLPLGLPPKYLKAARKVVLSLIADLTR